MDDLAPWTPPPAEQEPGLFVTHRRRVAGRMVYAAVTRCACGQVLGFAYEPEPVDPWDGTSSAMEMDVGCATCGRRYPYTYALA